jgi:single-stranded-DNA-specific exonuclease
MSEATLLEAPVRIDLPPYDLGAALALERELGVSHVLSQILVRRGYTDAAAVRELLSPSERHDASLFEGIDTTVELILGHVRSGTRIVVHGDYDVDGVCATAVLVRALRSLGADVGWYLPSRSEDGYGLSAGTVERLAANGTKLLVTVDCGITAVEEVAAARAAGLDVVITDHHSPRADGALPDCPIVHPVVGGHPSRDLCGTGVAHKLAEALGAQTAELDVELVALATVADLMPLRGENRRLVQEGLRQMAGTNRPGLRALMEVSRTDPSALDASCLGFRLAPRINAAGRLRRADAGLELLLTDDPARASEIARELDAVNAERRLVEQRIGWEAEAMAAEMGERSAYVLAGVGWHPGVIGIVASRIVERFHRPAILIALDPDDPAAPAGGSGRSIPGFDLLGALDAGASHLLRYGGHRAAAGLNILPEHIDAFREAIEEHAELLLTPELLTPVERVDAVVSGADLSLALAEELLALEPCGMGNPGVKLLVAGARFEDVRTMGDGKHARFTVVAGGVKANAVAFGCDGKVAGSDGGPLDASFRLERNFWNGVVEPRLILREAVPCAPEPITVLGEPDDYLEAMLMELDRDLEQYADELSGGEPRPTEHASEFGDRVVVDRRGESPLTTIADAQAAVAESSGILVICANAQRRLGSFAGRRGGFALITHEALTDEPEIVTAFEHVVVLDPPATEEQESITKLGNGYTYLAWGDPELRFAQQMHEQEYGLRASLVALYRSVRDGQRASGEEFERLLRGDGPHPRSARLAGRLVRILTELELVSLDLDLPALAYAGAQPTELERSDAYRVYNQTYEDGLRFLSRSKSRRTS